MDGSAVIRAADIPLPQWRHLPGRNKRHGEDAFEHIKALCPPRTDSAGAATNIAWHYGIRLFNESYFWEAHEVLETVWMRALPNSRERWLVQCIIHLANGALKRSIGQERAAARLAAMAEECLERTFAGQVSLVMGLAEEDLAENCVRLRSGNAALTLSDMQNTAP